MTPLLELHHLEKTYVLGNHQVTALNNVSFSIYPSEVVGVAGESGCGKTTLGKVLTGLVTLTSGHILYKGRELHKMKGKERKNYHSKVQIVLQDPYGSLNPRMTVEEIIGEGLQIHCIPCKNLIEEVMQKVNLPLSFLKRFPHELSGGQRQRVSIARALVLNPELIIFDESVSALDITHQKQIISLLKDLKKSTNMCFLFISHDLRILKEISHRIIIMRQGCIVEMNDTTSIWNTPKHPYTKTLLSAIPIPDPRLEKERLTLVSSYS